MEKSFSNGEGGGEVDLEGRNFKTSVLAATKESECNVVRATLP